MQALIGSYPDFEMDCRRQYRPLRRQDHFAGGEERIINGNWITGSRKVSYQFYGYRVVGVFLHYWSRSWKLLILMADNGNYFFRAETCIM